jgi:membrane protein
LVLIHKLHGINPEAYLPDVLTKLVNNCSNSRLAELTPWAWATAHRSSLPANKTGPSSPSDRGHGSSLTDDLLYQYLEVIRMGLKRVLSFNGTRFGRRWFIEAAPFGAVRGGAPARFTSACGERMTVSDVHRESVSESTQLAPPPSWVVLLSALLVATAMAWRSSGSVTAGNAHPPARPEADTAPREGERGRSATGPSEIPWPGWKDILLRVYHRLSRDRILLISAGVTFYLILAIFPGIAALVSIYGLFFDPRTMVSHLDMVASVAPGGAIDVLRDQLTRLGQQSGTALGLSFLFGLAVALWSATSGVKAIFDGLNVAYEEEEKRSFVRLTAVALMFTFALIAFVILTLAAVVAVPVALRHLPFAGATGVILNFARWPVLFVLLAFALSGFYRYGPSRAEPQWRWITWGSAFATILWLTVSVLFSWYVANFGSYNKTYGSLGAIVGFMTWVWLSVIVVLAGAQLNAEIEHQTARQSTSGPSKPLGARGAKMADTIGAAQP